MKANSIPLDLRNPASHWRLAATVFAFTLLLAGCQKTPQLANEECLAAADALWTAITARDIKLVHNCEQSLKQLHDQSKLANDAYETLESIISTARGGDWDGARGDLKAFVKGQRRPETGSG